MRPPPPQHAGMAYVGILFLLVIITAMGMAFLLQTATGLASVVNIDDGLRAEYLAEAGQNHAVWRLLYDPDIPTFEEAEALDQYLMVNFQGYRYGYNLWPHTATTFALVRTVGVAGDNVAGQSYVVNLASTPFEEILSLYGADKAKFVRQRNFVDPAWGNPADVISTQKPARWIRVEGSTSKTEAISATIDDNSDTTVSIFNGAAWGNSWKFTTSTDKNHSGIDVAYESISGRAMVAGRYTTGRNPYYSLWNGTAWSAMSPPTLINNPHGGGDVRTTRLAAHPNSNEIALVFLTSLRQLVGFIWNGNAWAGNALLTSDLAEAQFSPFAVAYEQLSGRALFIYAVAGGNQWHYRIWDGNTLSAAASLGSLSNKGRTLRLAPLPGSNKIAALAISSDRALTMGIWNGNAWTSVGAIATNLYSGDVPSAAVAWESSGEEALYFFTQGSNRKLIHYRRWNAADNSLGALQTGPNLGNDFRTVEALTIPGEDRIILLTGDSKSELKYVLWGGNGFEVSVPQMLHNKLYSINQQGYNLTSLLASE